MAAQPYNDVENKYQVHYLPYLATSITSSSLINNKHQSSIQNSSTLYKP